MPCKPDCKACGYLEYLRQTGWLKAFEGGTMAFLDIPILTFEEWKNAKT